MTSFPFSSRRRDLLQSQFYVFESLDASHDVIKCSVHVTTQRDFAFYEAQCCFFINREIFVYALCLNQLKNEAVALVDALAPPDFILNSPIGHSNGKVRHFNLF